MLSWGEMREMQRQGIIAQVEAEVRNAKAIIADALGVPVTWFAYLYGR
jgi:hypothetical protein